MAYTFSIIFLAGIVSFLSPCVLSLVPAYVGYLSGNNLENDRNVSSLRKPIINGLFFILGFSIVFVTLGFSATLLGQVLFDYKVVVAKIGGVIIFILGLQLTGLIDIPFLNFDLRHNRAQYKNMNLISSFFMGIFFSAGWSPCIGPVLGSILTAIVLSNLSVIQGVGYLAVYSLGLGIPFLAAAVGTGWVNTLLVRYKKLTSWLQIFSGGILVVFGIMLFFGIIGKLNQISPVLQLGL